MKTNLFKKKNVSGLNVPCRVENLSERELDTEDTSVNYLRINSDIIAMT